MKKLAYSIIETARILGISRSTVYTMINYGHLTTAKCGRRTLVLTESIEAWLKANSKRGGES